MKAFDKKTIAEKVSHISALVGSLPKEVATAEILDLIVTTLEDIAGAISGLKEDTEYLDAYVEEVDEDLGALEEDFYGDDDDCDCCDDDDCDCCCDDDEFVEVECPSCGEKVCIDDTVDLEHVICPACGEEFSCTCDDCCEDDDDCDCGCCHSEKK